MTIHPTIARIPDAFHTSFHIPGAHSAQARVRQGEEDRMYSHGTRTGIRLIRYCSTTVQRAASYDGLDPEPVKRTAFHPYYRGLRGSRQCPWCLAGAVGWPFAWASRRLAYAGQHFLIHMWRCRDGARLRCSRSCSVVHTTSREPSQSDCLCSLREPWAAVERYIHWSSRRGPTWP